MKEKRMGEILSGDNNLVIFKNRGPSRFSHEKYRDK
jgi:hypothetical protein